MMAQRKNTASILFFQGIRRIDAHALTQIEARKEAKKSKKIARQHKRAMWWHKNKEEVYVYASTAAMIVVGVGLTMFAKGYFI